MYQNLAMTVSAILITFVSLLFVGTPSLLQSQISTVKDDWYDKAEISVYVRPKSLASSSYASGEATATQINGVGNLITSGAPSSYVKSYQVGTEAQAYQDFMKAYAKFAIKRDATEDMISISFRTKLRNVGDYKLVAKQFEGHSGMERVVGQRSTLGLFFLVISWTSWIVGRLAIIMAVAVVLLISTTIRLLTVSRSRQTGIMCLVRVSNLFIQLPLILEGVIAVPTGAILTVATL